MRLREVCDDGGWTHDYVLKLFILKLNELYSYAMLNLFGLYVTALYLIVRLPCVTSDGSRLRPWMTIETASGTRLRPWMTIETT